MNCASPEDIRTFLISFLNQKLKERGRGQLCDLSDDYELSEIIDSLDLVEMMAAVAERYNRKIDFEGIDPEKMTVVGPLCIFISEQTAAQFKAAIP